MPLPRVEDSSDFLCPDLVNTIFVEISRTCRWFGHMFITREGSHGWSAKQTKQKCSSGKNCAENTLDIRNIRAKSKFSTKVAEPHQKPTELQRRWTAVLVTQQARQRKPQPPGIDGRMQLLKTSLISPKEDFWTTSQENSEAPTRNERNKDEREMDHSINRSINLRSSGRLNKPTMENAISGCKQNEIIQPCLTPRKDAICRATLQKKSMEDQRLKSERKAVRKTEHQ